jgi:sec-independent protein translocase protein TatB
MFDIGWSELVLIGIVALIVIGPKELPTVLRTVGQYMTKIRRMASEFQGQFQEAMREAEMDELKKNVDSLNQAATNLTSDFNPLGDVQKDIQKTFESGQLTPTETTSSSTTSETATPTTGEATTPPPAVSAPAAPSTEPEKPAGESVPEPRPAAAGSGAS